MFAQTLEQVQIQTKEQSTEVDNPKGRGVTK